MFSGHDDDAPLLPLPGSSEVTMLNTSNTKSSPPVGPIVANVIGGLCSLYRLFSSYCFAGADMPNDVMNSKQQLCGGFRLPRSFQVDRSSRLNNYQILK